MDMALGQPAPLHQNVAHQAEVESERRTLHSGQQVAAADQPGATHVLQPPARGDGGGHQRHHRDGEHHQREPLVDGRIEVDREPAGGDRHHEAEHTQREDARRPLNRDQDHRPFGSLLDGREGHHRRGRRPQRSGPHGYRLRRQTCQRGDQTAQQETQQAGSDDHPPQPAVEQLGAANRGVQQPEPLGCRGDDWAENP